MLKSGAVDKEISKLSLKTDRLEMVLIEKTEEIAGSVKILAEHTKTLERAIGDLQKIKESLQSDLEKTIKGTVQTVTPSLGKDLSEEFRKGTSALISNHSDTFKKVKDETDRAMNVLSLLATEARRRLVFRGIYLVATVCFSSFVMAAGLFHFFPQNVRYETRSEQGKQVVYGKVLMDNFKRLSPDNQALLTAALGRPVKNIKKEKSPVRTPGPGLFEEPALSPFSGPLL